MRSVHAKGLEHWPRRTNSSPDPACAATITTSSICKAVHPTLQSIVEPHAEMKLPLSRSVAHCCISVREPPESLRQRCRSRRRRRRRCPQSMASATLAARSSIATAAVGAASVSSREWSHVVSGLVSGNEGIVPHVGVSGDDGRLSPRCRRLPCRGAGRHTRGGCAAHAAQQHVASVVRLHPGRRHQRRWRRGRPMGQR